MKCAVKDIKSQDIYRPLICWAVLLPWSHVVSCSFPPPRESGWAWLTPFRESPRLGLREAEAKHGREFRLSPLSCICLRHIHSMSEIKGVRFPAEEQCGMLEKTPSL